MGFRLSGKEVKEAAGRTLTAVRLPIGADELV
jgi:hypothetical protein